MVAEIESELVVHDVHDRIYGPTRLFTNPNRAKGEPEPESTSKPEPESEPEPAPESAPEEPPLGGPGSGRDAWAAYADKLGLTVTDDMTRDDIVVLTRQHTGG